MFSGDEEIHKERQSEDTVKINVKENSIKIRVTHFSWYTAMMSYFFGDPGVKLQIMPYMHPSSLTNVEKLLIKLYVVREDVCQVDFLFYKNIRINPFKIAHLVYLNAWAQSCDTWVTTGKLSVSIWTYEGMQ